MKRTIVGALTRVSWLTGILLISATAAGGIVHLSAPESPPASSPDSFIHFSTLPPGARLPSDAKCARLVRASPSPENRPANRRFNETTGQHVGPSFFAPGDNPRVRTLASQIDGGFTGTTEEILRWAACKWGIDQDIVFAQAMAESWWQQDELGDWVRQAKFCPPGHGFGVDGKPGQCPASYGIFQDKYLFEMAAWPGVSTSTAMSVDAAYAIWRSCFDGYETWLNNQPHGELYHAGDVWGCVGRWSAGSWYTSVAKRYITLVKKYMHERVWEQPFFNKRISRH